MASNMQDLFLEDLSKDFKTTAKRLTRRLGFDLNSKQAAIIDNELRGLYHGALLVFDGGTELADHGLISIVDEHGEKFDRHLHEICFKHWPGTSG